MSEDSAQKPALVGVPFPKGTSGNPKGRPKSLATRLKMATRNGRDVVEVVDEIMMGKISAPPAVRLDAAKWIAERIWGKAPDIVAHVDATGGNAFLERMSASELRAFYEGVTAIRTIASAPASTQIPAALATVTAAPAPASAPKPSDSDAPASEDT